LGQQDPVDDRPVDVIPVLNGWVRGTLVFIALGLLAVFAVAVWLNPYDGEGRPRLMETHRQMGLPPCTFKVVTGLPCPSCGMTTSFALLLHGDVWNSLKANAVGTLLASFCLALVPWNLACAARGRPYFIWSIERALTRLIVIFLVLLLARWVVVLALAWGANGFTVPAGGTRPADPAGEEDTGDAPRGGPGAERGSRRRGDGGNPETLAAGRPDRGRGGPVHRLQHVQPALLPHDGAGPAAAPAVHEARLQG
jgi:hypothetical protein